MRRELEAARRQAEKYDTISGELDTSPWEALLRSIRASAYRSEWIDAQIDGLTDQLARVESDSSDVVLPDGVSLMEVLQLLKDDRDRWLQRSLAERALLGKLSDVAIKAGLSERIVADIESQSKIIAQVVSASLSAAELDEGQRRRALEAMRRELKIVAEDMQRHVMGMDR